MIRHRFLDKCNTILKNSKINTGLNPVVELNAGKTTSRILLHFNIDDMLDEYKNREINTNSLKHYIKMFNCGSINLPYFEENVESGCDVKNRASSFDIIAVKVPYVWDRGRGFDYQGDYVKESHNVVSTDGSNWYCCQTGVKWDEPGVYSYSDLDVDISLIVGRQHFEYGTENLELDVTDYVNNILLGTEKNYGLCLMFEPKYEKGEGYELLRFPPEDTDIDNTMEINYVPNDKIIGFKYLLHDNNYYEWNVIRTDNKFISFFGPETNTFFNPYLETINTEVIEDNRYNFHLGVKNKLYFYASNNGDFFNLDHLPTCTINDEIYPVKQAGKGIYYVEIKYNKNEIEPETICYDVWSDIVIDGEELEDVEMEFVVLPFEKRISLGKQADVSDVEIIPSIYGINDSENVKIGDVREIKVDFIEEYSRGKKIYPSKVEYRLYVKEGKREIDIFPYQKLDKMGENHCFIVNTNDLIPNTYYVDIRVTNGRNVKHFENVLEFNIVHNITKYNK